MLTVSVLVAAPSMKEHWASHLLQLDLFLCYRAPELNGLLGNIFLVLLGGSVRQLEDILHAMKPAECTRVQMAAVVKVGVKVEIGEHSPACMLAAWHSGAPRSSPGTRRRPPEPSRSWRWCPRR